MSGNAIAPESGALSCGNGMPYAPRMTITTMPRIQPRVATRFCGAAAAAAATLAVALLAGCSSSSGDAQGTAAAPASVSSSAAATAGGVAASASPSPGAPASVVFPTTEAAPGSAVPQVRDAFAVLQATYNDSCGTPGNCEYFLNRLLTNLDDLANSMKASPKGSGHFTQPLAWIGHLQTTLAALLDHLAEPAAGS
jgi:hypothetical protein